jgi:hypothetical protein
VPAGGRGGRGACARARAAPCRLTSSIAAWSVASSPSQSPARCSALGTVMAGAVVKSMGACAGVSILNIS